MESWLATLSGQLRAADGYVTSEVEDTLDLALQRWSHDPTVREAFTELLEAAAVAGNALLRACAEWFRRSFWQP